MVESRGILVGLWKSRKVDIVPSFPSMIVDPDKVFMQIFVSPSCFSALLLLYGALRVFNGLSELVHTGEKGH